MPTSRVSPRQWTAGTAAWFTRWTGGFADLLYPPACLFCGDVIERTINETGAGRPEQTELAKQNVHAGHVGLCPACRSKFIDASPACSRCGEPLPVAGGQPLSCPRCRLAKTRFDALTRLGRYEGPLREAVLRTKQGYGEPLAMALAKALFAERGAEFAAMKLQTIAPMPMHWTRRLARGTNGPETIARVLARELAIPLKHRLLRRVRATRTQYDLTPPQRRLNVRGAFRAQRLPALKGARVLLVDDVLTTGATANEAARELRSAGATFVAVAVLARTLET